MKISKYFPPMTSFYFLCIFAAIIGNGMSMSTDMVSDFSIGMRVKPHKSKDFARLISGTGLSPSQFSCKYDFELFERHLPGDQVEFLLGICDKRCTSGDALRSDAVTLSDNNIDLVITVSHYYVDTDFADVMFITSTFKVNRIDQERKEYGSTCFELKQPSWSNATIEIDKDSFANILHLKLFSKIGEKEIVSMKDDISLSEVEVTQSGRV